MWDSPAPSQCSNSRRFRAFGPDRLRTALVYKEALGVYAQTTSKVSVETYTFFLFRTYFIRTSRLYSTDSQTTKYKTFQCSLTAISITINFKYPKEISTPNFRRRIEWCDHRIPPPLPPAPGLVQKPWNFFS